MDSAHRRDVIVLGGGISGLTAAWRLKKAGVDVRLVEASPFVGGYTRTDVRDGFLLEKGPFNVIVRDPSFEELLDDFAADVTVVSADKVAKNRYIYRGGRVHKVPSSPIGLMTTGLLSFPARCRLIGGLVVSGEADDTEQTIERAATRRLGAEAAQTLVSAGISGVYAGDIRRLSLNACFPTVARIDAEARSLIGYGLRSAFKGRKKTAKRHRRRWPGMVNLDGGLGALTAAMGGRLGADLIIRCSAESIRAVDGGYEIECTSRGDEGAESHALRCRRLVTALPVGSTARLLDPLIPEGARAIAPIESSSLAVLSLGFRKADVGHPLAGFGFLVPQDEPDFPLMGVLWADSAFPHHAPPDSRLLRIFIGGARDPGAVERSDDQLLATAMGGLRELLRLSRDPVLVDVCRHREAIPQYYLGHRERIETLRTAVATQPGLQVIGNFLEGVSLNDCVRLATSCADGMIGSGRGSDAAAATAPAESCVQYSGA